MIRLYDYWRSSASYRVRIALGLAGLEWETVSVDLTSGAQVSQDHLGRNPQGLVPVLDIDGLRLTQSLAIIEYLDETRTLGLLPAQPADRARVRALAYAIAMEIHPVCNLGVARHAVAASEGRIGIHDWMAAFIPPRLAALEQMVGTGGLCHGDTVTLADICLVPQLYNARRWQLDLSAMPNLLRIEAALTGRPAFARAHPDKCPDAVVEGQRP